jgi:uncharacterized protein GlcG (DUF336 family)
MSIDLKTANRMIAAGRQLAREKALRPLAFCVLDANGHIVSAQREGGTLLNFDLAYAKAWGSLGMGHSTRYLKDVLLKEQPDALSGMQMVSRGRLVAQYGGVLVRDVEGELIGAIGVAGDTDDNDEVVALAVIDHAGLQADLS